MIDQNVWPQKVLFYVGHETFLIHSFKIIEARTNHLSNKLFQLSAFFICSLTFTETCRDKIQKKNIVVSISCVLLKSLDQIYD